MEIARPYLLFLGDVHDALAAKTALGIVDWRLAELDRLGVTIHYDTYAGADDVLEQARIAESLTDAIADCVHAVGCTARLRDIRLPMFEPAAAAGRRG